MTLVDCDSPFHAGERAAQERAGVRERTERQGRRMIRDFMPEQHRLFFAQLPFLLVGALDGEGRPWATLAAGAPGFASSPDPRTLVVEARPLGEAALGLGLGVGAPLGLLGIELSTRRRNRMNGRVVVSEPAGFAVRVDQSFGNCPQYIQVREPAAGAASAPRIAGQEGASLSAAARAALSAADTLFLATASPAARERSEDSREGLDLSHRGGRPGFVKVEAAPDGASLLTLPDFRGNFAFNTLGNLELEPRAGLLVPDFASGSLLLLSGSGEVLWDDPEIARFAGAERLLRYRVERALWIERALPARWTPPLEAPQLAATGRWAEGA
ncbi:hypothetical protein SAMN06265365_10545 [Tistlia consotensis]|uniref:Uncharacterized protein n=1 Tax=Tistlia consotensis USBA 355 TaxID=560819 RepID=A0A1Y6BQE9_9PROT|nr:pyridoxamine 5'-phosphate oxidase family protein [Tistlia consotensis]SMF14257.1 hypothetical protein SAMN05428998_105253 [Tistlia consotensis USBA 355]SNR49643.1 hypothetical protein SAMN06265365_10545 [Tistlia consotensis]